MLRFLMPCLPALLLLAACSTQSPAPAVAVISSPADDSRYEYLQLPNGLRAVLVSDPKAPKSAASLDVFVGSGHEPADRPGLAHFLEHMLFLGTEKYPQPDEYQAFIAAHGGSHNAYTSYEHTNYFFNIEHGFLPEGLDRFAQFFIAPRFDAAYVGREKHAVDSEYHARIRDEGRRGLDVLLQVANPDHPFNRFSIGSLDTLADREGRSVRDDLLAFYRRYYAAPAMTLVVVSNRPLAELRGLVMRTFAAVPAQPVERELAREPLFRPGVLPVRLNVQPEQERRELSLVFPVPELVSHYRTKPLDYIAGLLGHEGPGSLLAYLKQQGWVDSLSAGAGLNFTNAAVLSIDMDLTAQGLQHVDAIIHATFQALARIRSEGLQAWRYDEQARMSALHFRYLEKTDPDDFAIHIANNLQHYPPAEVLRGDYLMEGFPEALVRQYLDHLVPDNLLVMVTAKDLPADRRTQRFHVPYSVQALPAATLAAWRTAAVQPAIRLPDANAFLPQRLDLVGESRSDLPQQRVAEPGLSVWVLPDSRFGVPRGNAIVRLYNPAATRTARELVLRSLYAGLLNDRLQETLYPAWLAGIGFSINPGRQGFDLRVSGFDDRQPLVLAQLAQALRTADIDPAAFARIKDSTVQGWINSSRIMPFRRLVNGIHEALDPLAWSGEALAAAAADVSFADVQDYAQHFLQDVTAEALLYGNYGGAQWQAMADSIRPLVTASRPRPPQAVHVPAAGARERLLMPVLHDDAAVLLYAAGADASLHETALMALTGQLLQSSFFNQLRTEQQLGYVVHAAAYPVLHLPGVMFIVQSPTHDVPSILAAITAYGENILDSIDEQSFETSRRALVGRYREPATNPQEMADRLWEDLSRYRIQTFDRREQLAQALQAISFAQWQAFARTQVLGAQRRGVLLYSPGKRGVPAAGLDRQWGPAAAAAGATAVLE